MLIALLLGAAHLGLEASPELGLELRTGFRLFFGCERRGAFSFAFNL
jgi:hypothetical protein